MNVEQRGCQLKVMEDLEYIMLQNILHAYIDLDQNYMYITWKILRYEY